MLSLYHNLIKKFYSQLEIDLINNLNLWILGKDDTFSFLTQLN